MFIDQDLIDNYVVGLTEYISHISNDYLYTIINNDFKKIEVENRLMYAVNLRRSLYNYDYSSGFFTDAELQHLLEQSTILADEMPNNSIYGSKNA
jgi:hypothetical protein